VFIDPTKVGFLALDPPASCSSFSLGSWWSSSLGLLPLSSLEGAVIRLELRTTPDRNSSKQKHYENMIYKPRVLRGFYSRKLNIETKSEEETGTKTRSGVVSPQGGVAWSGPAPLVVRSHRTPSPSRFRLMIFHI
jgi:hypothetical protein